MNGYYIRRRDYWDFFMKEEDNYLVFLDSNQIEEKKKIYAFNKFVNVVNLETSAYCNRKCRYCPMAFIEREQDYIKEEVFRKIILELEQIRYRGHISLCLYNEPFFDEKIIHRISYIKKKLPDCYIKLNSNGDKLSEEMLAAAWSAGLNQVLVTLHASPNGHYEDDDREKAIELFLDKVGLRKYYCHRKILEGKKLQLIFSMGSTEF